MNKLVITFLALMATVSGVALAADAAAGKVAFDKTCKGCHGEGGATPNDNIGKMLGATIPTLASPEFQASKTDDDIRTAVTAGKGKMPAALKTAPAGTVDDVIAYVRSLKK